MTSCTRLTLPLKTMSDPCVSITPRGGPGGPPGAPLGPAGQRQEQRQLQAAQHFSVAQKYLLHFQTTGTHTHRHTETCTHTYTHPHTYTHVHTRTHTQPWLRAVEMSTGYLYKGMTVVFSVILERLVNGEQFVASCGGVWCTTNEDYVRRFPVATAFVQGFLVLIQCLAQGQSSSGCLP